MLLRSCIGAGIGARLPVNPATAASVLQRCLSSSSTTTSATTNPIPSSSTPATDAVKLAANDDDTTATTTTMPPPTHAPTLSIPRTSTLMSTHAFDKHRVTQQLVERGLNVLQAEAVMEVLDEVITESLKTMTRNTVTKAEQERHVFKYQTDFTELRNELQMLEKSDFNMLKAENDRLMAELDKAKALMREEINKLQSNVRQDMNLEKGRLRDEALVQEAKIKETDKRIETEIKNISTQLETLKFDIFKYIIGSAISALTLLIGYYRLFK